MPLCFAGHKFAVSSFSLSTTLFVEVCLIPSVTARAGDRRHKACLLYHALTLETVQGIGLLSPDPGFCNARSLPAFLSYVGGAIIIPDEEVNIHGKNIVEVIAPVSLKETLSLHDGDRITLMVTAP